MVFCPQTSGFPDAGFPQKREGGTGFILPRCEAVPARTGYRPGRAESRRRKGQGCRFAGSKSVANRMGRTRAALQEEAASLTSRPDRGYRRHRVRKASLSRPLTTREGFLRVRRSKMSPARPNAPMPPMDRLLQMPHPSKSATFRRAQIQRRPTPRSPRQSWASACEIGRPARRRAAAVGA